MSIVSCDIVLDVASGARRRVVYSCTDHLGQQHRYGPVYTHALFDAEAHKTVVSERVAAALAETEAAQQLGGE